MNQLAGKRAKTGLGKLFGLDHHNDNIKYDESLTGRKKSKNRSRKIIWFRPPWSDSISTNIRAKFLKLVRKHFGKPNQLNKIFNKN